MEDIRENPSSLPTKTEMRVRKHLVLENVGVREREREREREKER